MDFPDHERLNMVWNIDLGKHAGDGRPGCGISYQMVAAVPEWLVSCGAYVWITAAISIIAPHPYIHKICIDFDQELIAL